MIGYSVVDMLLSAVSVALILLILSTCHRSLLNVQVDNQSVMLTAIGLALIVTSTLKFFAWAAELYFLRTIGNVVRFSFIHYTIDEPLWIALNVALGTYFPVEIPSGWTAKIVFGGFFYVRHCSYLFIRISLMEKDEERVF